MATPIDVPPSKKPKKARRVVVVSATPPPPADGQWVYVRNKDLYNNDTWCWWLFFIFIFVAILVWVVVAFYTNPWPPFPPPPIIINATGGAGSYVFRNLAGKRSDCKVGERWDQSLGMCAPVFNAPMAFERLLLNDSVAPCASFYNHMCGTWMAQHSNEDRAFSFLWHRNQKALERLMTAQPASPLGRAYAACVNEQFHPSTLEVQHEYRHVREHVLGDLRSYADLPSVFGRMARYGFVAGAPFALSIERDPTQRRVLPYLAWDGVVNVTMADVSARFEASRALTQHSGMVIVDRVRRAWKVAEAIRRWQPSAETQFLPTTIPFSSLPVWHTPHANPGAWTSFLQSLDGLGLRFAPSQPLWLEPSTERYLRAMLAAETGWLTANLELLDWSAYMEFVILHNMHEFAPALPMNVYRRTTAFRGRMLRNATRSDCVRVTQQLVPGLVAQAFVASQRDALDAAKRETRKMVEHLIGAFESLINETAWLPAEARRRARHKLRSIVVRVAEPDEWEPEPFAERLSAERYAHNVNLVRRYRVHRNLQQWHRDDPSHLDPAGGFFYVPLHEVNAYYAADANSITVLAGLLQPPLYSAAYNAVSRYAILGSVIGHELAHALDLHGVHWDASGCYTGNATTIWDDPAVDDAYGVRARGVAAEFNAETVPLRCNVTEYGEATLNEDLADFVGVRAAYRACFGVSANANGNVGVPPCGTTRLADKQYFFMVFSQAWCATYDANRTCARINSDVHAWPEYRVDVTFRNMPEFGQAFFCREGDRMAGGTAKLFG
jgi:predicted metalloendopeptidase